MEEVRYCLCNCGGIVTRTRERFIRGHSKNLANQEPPSCKCNCGEKVAFNKTKNKWNEYVAGHYKPQARQKPLCSCGCGEIVNHPRSKYIRGHQTKGKIYTEEERKRISERTSGEKNPNFGKKHTKEARRKMSVVNIGRKWTEEHRLKIKAINDAKRKPKIQKPCACGCGQLAAPGNDYVRFHHHNDRSEETLNKMSESHKGQPGWMAGKTAKTDPRILSGEKHGRWKGGINPINKAIRNIKEYRDWRTAVFARDNYTCQECNKHGVRFHAHHKYPFNQILTDNDIKTIEDAYNCEELWDINNGITYCKKCHKEIHSLMVLNNTTREVTTDAIFT